MSPMERPGFTPTAAATNAATKSKSKFFDISANATAFLRFLPTPLESGSLFYRTDNHFNIKDQDGNGIALACLASHGTDETGEKCWICDLIKHLLEEGAPDEKKIAKGTGSLGTGAKFYAEVLVGEQIEGGLKYGKPVLWGTNFDGKDAVTGVLSRMELMKQPPFTDADQGQTLMITRTDTDKGRKKITYTAERTGVIESLDSIRPDWVELYIRDMLSYLDLRVMTRDQQRAYVKHTYGDRLDWARIEAAGL